MRIARRGPKKAFWGLIFLVLLGVYLSTFRVVRVDNWQVRTVIHSLWSSENAPTSGDALHGPYAFTLDSGGNMIVADSGLGGFTKYAPDGAQLEFLKTDAENPLPTRIESDGRGFVYGVDPERKAVLRYGPDGSAVAVYSRPFGEIYFVEGIGLFGTETLYVQDVGFEQDHYTRKLSRMGPGSQSVVTLASVKRFATGEAVIDDENPITAEVDDFAVGRDGTLCIAEASSDPSARDIKRITVSGKTSGFTIRQQQEIRGLRLLGLDSSGNVYVAMVLGDRLHPVVERYGASGQRLSMVELKGVTGTSISGRVDPNGNFYVTRMSETGYCIDKYVLKTQTKLLSRFSAK